MLIARKYWSPEYKKVALGYKANKWYYVIVVSNDGIAIHHS